MKFNARSIVELVLYSCLLFIIFGVTSISAQGISASISINPFPSPYLSDWETNPSLVQLSLNNDSTEMVTCQIFVSIIKDGNQTIASGESNYFDLPAGASETILTPDLINYSSVDYDHSYEDVLVRTGRLPEGSYELCVTLRDNSGINLVDNFCVLFEIIYPDPPYLLYPFDKDTVSDLYPVFQWQPVQTPVNFPVTYSITVAEIQENKTALQALSETEYYQLREDELTMSNLSYPPFALPLTNGSEYAWQVRVVDENGAPVSSNDGYSEIWSFIFNGTNESVATSGDLNSIQIIPAGQESNFQNVLQLLNQETFEAVKAEYERIRDGGEVVIPLPGLGDFAGFSVPNIAVSIDTEHKVIAFRGKTERYNEPNAEVLLTLKFDKGLKCAISIKLPNFSFGNVFVTLASHGRFKELATDFSVLVFSNDKQTLSSNVLPSGVKDYFDTLAVPVEQGMNYFGVINLERTRWFEAVVNFIGVESNQVVLTGHGGPVRNLLSKKPAKEFDLSLSAQFPAKMTSGLRLWMNSRQFELKGGVKRELAQNIDTTSTSSDTTSTKTNTSDSTESSKPDTSMISKYTPYLELKETIKGSFGSNKERSFYRLLHLEQETTDSTGKVTFEFGTEDTLNLGFKWLKLRDAKLLIEPDKDEPKVALFGGINIGDVKVSDSLFVEIGKADTTKKLDFEGSRTKDSTYRQADSVSGTVSGSTKKFSFRAKAQLADKFRLMDIINIAKSTMMEEREQAGGESKLQIPDDFFDLSNLGLGFSAGVNEEFFFSGHTQLMQSETDFLLSIAKDEDKKRVFTIGVKPENWKLTEAIPALSNPVLDNINFSRVGFVITNKESSLHSSDLGPDTYEFYNKIYNSDEYELTLKPGINLIAVIPLENMSPDDPLITLMEHLGMESGRIYLQGTFGNVFGLMKGESGGLIKDIYLKAALPPMHPPNSPAWFKSGELALEVTGLPSVGLVGAITVEIEGDVLTFFVGGKIARDGAGVAVAVVGGLEAEEPWVAPFGIKFLTLNKVVLKVSINAYGNIGLGFAGDLVIGEKPIKTSVAVAVNAYTGVPTNFIFDGESEEGVDMIDLAKLQNKMAAAATGGNPPMLPVEMLPDLAIKDMKLKFAPKSDPDLGVEAGMAIKGDLLMGKGSGKEMSTLAAVDCNVGIDGIWAKGELAEFAIGPLTWQDALIDLQLVPSASHFIINGEVDLLGSSKMVDLLMTRDTLSFASETEIDGLYTTKLSATGGFNLTNPSFKVHGEFQSDFNELLEGYLAGGLARFAEGGQAAIDASLEAFKKAEQLKEQKQQAVDELKRQLEITKNKAKEIMLKAKGIRDIEYNKRTAAANIKNRAYRIYRSISAWKAKEKANALISYRSKLAAYRIQSVKFSTANAAYLAKLTIYTAIPDLDNNPALVALKDQSDKLWAELEKQKQNLERLQLLLQKINEYLTASGTVPLKIQKAEFDSSLDNLVAGKGIELQLELDWLGEAKEIKTSFNLKDQREGIKSILEALING